MHNCKQNKYATHILMIYNWVFHYVIKTRNYNYFLLVFVSLIFLFITPTQAQNAVTKQGESTSSGTNYVNEYGQIVGYTALTKFGEILYPCKSPFTDSRDGNTYNIVRIGDQCWMAENLKYLPSVSPPTTTGGTPYYYVYDYNGTNVLDAKATSNYNTYGVLYNWFAAVGVWIGSSTNPSGIQGVCPNGWHVPSLNEWLQMTNYLSSYPQYWCDGNSSYIAKALASTTGWTDDITTCAVGNNSSSNNKAYFNGLPGGGLTSSGTFSGLNTQAFWWTATSVATPLSYYVGLTYIEENKIISIQRRDLQALSVRCVRDDCPYLTAPVGTTHNATPNQIQWNWGAVTDATGYKYNIVNDYNSGIDIGSNTSFTQTSLNCATAYTLYVWAYGPCGSSPVATLNTSTSPCPPCGGITQFTDSRDSKIYNTVEIGSQCWMKENLNYAAVGSWCYNDNAANCNTYGRLYSWYTLMNGSSGSNNNPSGVQGICPSGWHVPSLSEWEQLTNYLQFNGYNYDGTTDWDKVGKSISATSSWTYSAVTGAVGNTDYPAKRNITGFTALPAGIRDGGYIEIGMYASFATTYEDGTSNNRGRKIYYNQPNVAGYSINKNTGQSLRCVKD